MIHLSLVGILLGLAISLACFPAEGVQALSRDIPRTLLVFTYIIGGSVAAMVGFFGLLPFVIARTIDAIITHFETETISAWVPSLAG